MKVTSTPSGGLRIECECDGGIYIVPPGGGLDVSDPKGPRQGGARVPGDGGGSDRDPFANNGGVQAFVTNRALQLQVRVDLSDVPIRIAKAAIQWKQHAPKFFRESSRIEVWILGLERGKTVDISNLLMPTRKALVGEDFELVLGIGKAPANPDASGEVQSG